MISRKNRREYCCSFFAMVVHFLGQIKQVVPCNLSMVRELIKTSGISHFMYLDGFQWALLDFTAIWQEISSITWSIPGSGGGQTIQHGYFNLKDYLG